MSRKRILFLVHSASRTGAPLLVRDIAAALPEERFECAFALADDGPLRRSFENIGEVTVLPIYPRGPKYLREIPHALNRIGLLRRFKPDLVYCNTIHPVKWIPYSHLLKIPVVTHVHELSHGFASLGPAEYSLLRKSDSIIAVSLAVANYLTGTQHVSAQKIVTIHAGIVPRKQAARDPVLRDRFASDGSVLVGLVGRITPMKGSDMLPQLIDAVVRECTSRQGSNVRLKFLLVASTDDRASYDALRVQLNRSGHSAMVSIVTDVADPGPLYACMDIFLMLSREDPFPLVVQEAMEARLPIVAFATGGIPEAVDASCGILIPPFEIDQMAPSLVQLASDPVARQTLGAAGAERVKDKFNLQHNVEKIISHLETVINSHRKS